jgi:CubicO group peptidase (beta-lactamase class C family)
VLLFAAFLSACSAQRASRTAERATRPSTNDQDVSKSKEYWPTDGWRSASPSEEGMNGAMLDAALAAASQKRLQLHGMLVVRHGFIVKEAYFPPYEEGTAHELYSCTKSFTSALVGIALDRGYLHDLSQPALGFFPGRRFKNMDARKKAMTVENLLTMRSGLGWVEADPTYREMYTSSRDWVSYVLDLPMESDPGAEFRYSSGNSHVLSAIIQKTGKSTYGLASEALFEPLGIPDPAWERDPAGIPIGGWGLQLSPRDMAKLGYLYLHDGKWDGRQVVPEPWVRASTHARPPATERLGYGYQWWVDSTVPLYAALGRLGQGIFVVPALDMVVVFTAAIDSSDPEFDLIRTYIVPACGEGKAPSSS